MNRFDESLDAAELRFAVVVSRFNHLLCVRLRPAHDFLSSLKAPGN